ncbi:CUB and sushi domain-containing protein 3-like [Salarias fasciatus]|uniref:CUB and sushi domain-containing protein 3-like n=1 Tax=Salarias fasciatus TaxID=181472 RepID=UPI001176921F|nr:CUB and sushi domain-containing protein 3-like [Salarias fasciatus]
MKLAAFFLSLQLWATVDVSLSLDVCSKVPDIPHGHVSEETKKSEYQEGDVIHFSCDAGYIADLTSKYVCTSEGWLVIRRGTCYSCATLPDVPDAHVAEETRRDEYREGDVVHFTCDLGHSSELIIKYLCTSEGWLAVRRGSCNLTASSCEFPPAPEDLRIKGLPENQSPIRPDHILTFSCDGPGKYLLGSSVLICGRDGQWNNPFPSCTDVRNTISHLLPRELETLSEIAVRRPLSCCQEVRRTVLVCEDADPTSCQERTRRWCADQPAGRGRPAETTSGGATRKP